MKLGERSNVIFCTMRVSGDEDGGAALRVGALVGGPAARARRGGRRGRGVPLHRRHGQQLRRHPVPLPLL